MDEALGVQAAEGLKPRAALTIAALGVVYGDIGTSPLYALRECFVGVSGFPVDHHNVFGILSLMTWSLIVVVAVKYLRLVLRADNDGEGGILALVHLLVPDDIERWSRVHWALIAVGLFGAALLFGDGILTPALSVLSAVEGLGVAAPALEGWVVPITVGILAGLFAVQRFGTGRVGQLFGPITLVWFATLGGLGLYQILLHPHVLNAFSPHHAVLFFQSHGLHGTLILGAVFLTVTGAEALYADLGHFGAEPIRRSWTLIVFPGLLLNYYGQGALLLMHPEAVEDVFYAMAPSWAVWPLIILATLATIVASQAVISGVFSLTAQAVQLQYFPRTVITHTSADQRGQVYVPAANTFLLIGTLALVVLFRSSGGLADAYGIAVSLTMTITTVLLYLVMRQRWGWGAPLAVSVTAVLLAVDVAFFSSIVRKVAHGGWIPLTIALVLVVVMGVWRRGRQRLVRRPAVDLEGVAGDGPLVVLVRDFDQVVPGPDRRPVALLHVNQCHRPIMTMEPHGQLRRAHGRPLLHACYGYMEKPDIPALLAELAGEHDLGFDPAEAHFLVLRERPGTGAIGLLYALLARAATPLAASLGIPPDRLVELER